MENAGQIAIGAVLDKLGVKYTAQKKIRNLDDNELYRIADFHLTKQDIYIEYFADWDIKNGKRKARDAYRNKMKILDSNGIKCIYIYPDGLKFCHNTIQYDLLKYGVALDPNELFQKNINDMGPAIGNMRNGYKLHDGIISVVLDVFNKQSKKYEKHYGSEYIHFIKGQYNKIIFEIMYGIQEKDYEEILDRRKITEILNEMVKSRKSHLDDQRKIDERVEIQQTIQRVFNKYSRRYEKYYGAIYLDFMDGYYKTMTDEISNRIKAKNFRFEWEAKADILEVVKRMAQERAKKPKETKQKKSKVRGWLLKSILQRRK